MKLRKKLLTLLLVCIMVIPGSLVANAATTALVTDYSSLVTALSNKVDLIVILNDITLEDTLNIDYNVSFTSYNNESPILNNTYGKTHITVTGTDISISFENIVLYGENWQGGIYSTADSLLIQNAYIIKCTFAVRTEGNLIIDGGTYSQGSVGILCNGDLTIEDGNIEDNRVTGYGCGISCSGTVTINGGRIANNFAGGNTPCNGAGIYINGGTLNINGGEISNNTVYGNGGGIFIAGGTLNMYGGEISGNSALYYFTDNGGGIYATSSTINIYGGTITGNLAGAGGGIYAVSCILNIAGGDINSNTPDDIYSNTYYTNNNSSETFMKMRGVL